MGPIPRDLPQRRRRLQRVMEHIGAALRAGPPAGDDTLCLPALARVACWSPEHLDRIYRLHVGESPMATVRRLRLQAAADGLRAGQGLSVVAERAGYASTQAFGRAFERQFGCPPARWARAQQRQQAAVPGLRITTLPAAHACHLLRYEGESTGVSAFFDEVVTRLQRSGAPRSQWQVFGRGDEAAAAPVQRRAGARVVLEAAVLAAPLCRPPQGFGCGAIASGTYARVPVGPLAGLDEPLREAGWQRSGEQVLRHYDTDPAYTPPPERREWLYVPVRRRG
jgi:AraC family transcriptional regulator